MVAEHRQPADGLGRGRLVLKHVPVLGELAVLDADDVGVAPALAAARITSSTAPGLESMGTWLLSTSTVVAPIRRAADRCSSGWTVRSCLATMNQLGFERQATPSAFWVNRSGTGTAWVAQTSFCSGSGRSPAKQGTPSGRNQMRPSATSMWPKPSVVVRATRRDIDQGDNPVVRSGVRSEEHTSELQSPDHLVCRLLLEKKKK